MERVSAQFDKTEAACDLFCFESLHLAVDIVVPCPLAELAESLMNCLLSYQQLKKQKTRPI